MTDLSTSMRERVNNPETRKVFKYSMVSVVSLVVTLGVVSICVGLLKWNEVASQFTASVAGAIPSYYLNRMWVWGKSGKSHMRKEVIPFWIMFAVGLAFATGAVSLSTHLTANVSHRVHTLIVTSSSFGAYGILWIAKYAIFNKFLFAHREDELDPVLDGRSGLPT